MKYFSAANSNSNNSAVIKIKDTEVSFGITPETADLLPNPAELFLGSFCACVLKNVERFSHLMNFTYSNADIKVEATRSDKPPKMEEIHYELTIFSDDESINIPLLKKNIEKFGTIYNTASKSCLISGEIIQVN